MKAIFLFLNLWSVILARHILIVLCVASIIKRFTQSSSEHYFLPGSSPLSLKLAVGTPHSEKMPIWCISTMCRGDISLSSFFLYCTYLYSYLKCSHITRGYYCTYLFLKYFAPTEARNYIYSHITRGYYWTYLNFYLISRCPPPWPVPTSPCNLCIDNGDHDGQWWGWELGIRFKVFCQISLPLVMVISMERFRNDLTIFVRSIYQW